MSTPINNLPLKTKQINNDEIEDPQVQDILKEFEEEIIASKKQPQKIIPNIPIQQPQQQPILHQQYQPQQQKNNIITNDYINNDYIKKALIITLVTIIIFYPNVFIILIRKLPIPSSIILMVEKNDFYIKSILVFIGIYIIMYYKLL